MSTAAQIKEHLDRAVRLLDPAYAPFIDRQALMIRIGELQFQWAEALGLSSYVLRPNAPKLITYEPTKGT